MDIYSKVDCEALISRILRTLEAVTPTVVGTIQPKSRRFRNDDSYVFEGLCLAILSIQAVWNSVERNKTKIKTSMFNYSINRVASLSDDQVADLYEIKFKPLKIQAKFLKQELTWIRDSAKVFQGIAQSYESVWKFIRQYIERNEQDRLMNHFIKSGSHFKLSGVGRPICCEFFNNIGIDEFKPDEHATRFFNRIGVARGDKPKEIRMIGITIAATSGRTRKYVDSLIWNFCAEGRGEICTKNPTQCDLCLLKTEEPMLCQGFSSKSR